ncbi:MAG: Clp protease N-terminal domain-containing protein, partial [Hyphomicrobium sp.]
MGYRGEDLDLRTPQTWTAGAADPIAGQAVDTLRSRTAQSPGTSRSGPIWVDDVVLACSNHAFDVALAHRASEVRLEHLLHALTRIDPAADVLESYGLRVGQLRRDTATVIASEIPASLGNGKTVPRRSDELEDVLRMAAAIASRRNSPASVEDLLQVILDAAPDVPGLQLIQRSMGARPLVNTYPEVMTPMVRNPYAYDPMEAGRDRLRGGYQQGESLMRGAPADSIQNSRLDVLEQMVRTFGHDLQNERKMLA